MNNTRHRPDHYQTSPAAVVTVAAGIAALVIATLALAAGPRAAAEVAALAFGIPTGAIVALVVICRAVDVIRPAADGQLVLDQPSARPLTRSQPMPAESDDAPYADGPDAGNTAACNCHGAWHAMQQHCIDWPCPGCDGICPPEPGTEAPMREAAR